MSVKLLTEHNLMLLSLIEGCKGSSESTLVKMSYFWKLRVTAHIIHQFYDYGFYECENKWHFIKFAVNEV